jgi:hypothetical protein
MANQSFLSKSQINLSEDDMDMEKAAKDFEGMSDKER